MNASGTNIKADEEVDQLQELDLQVEINNKQMKKEEQAPVEQPKAE